VARPGGQAPEPYHADDLTPYVVASIDSSTGFVWFDEATADQVRALPPAGRFAWGRFTIENQESNGRPNPVFPEDFERSTSITFLTLNNWRMTPLSCPRTTAPAPRKGSPGRTRYDRETRYSRAWCL
jgi:hypothetical protein